MEIVCKGVDRVANSNSSACLCIVPREVKAVRSQIGIST
jgi:hypothetical protein